ncbi:glycosyltransferase [Thioalkalivibrio sp. XN279]|uniref:glycosyltransferase family 2 protein n=1 Tax=Thioalkalivibrio sp. XN279 TaxID=2714953 RepID=UPI00140D35E7|nr:glycosyltransferase [Thioalkalivibrio sp. XN279]NHA16049.1 glycosyltransferase [Thioalkalivibrio sp. XN279]
MIDSLPTNKPPKVSIGLPVFNGERYLHEALDSLLGQTFGDFELIISDNASTDATAEIVRGYERSDPRIRYFRQETNIGIGRNFLFVLHQSRGEMFMWASHDDVWDSTWLELLTKHITVDDAGVRGALFLVRGDATIVEKRLPAFRHRDFIRCFLGNENNYRSHYTYSLFNREKLLKVKQDILLLDYYPDAIFVYALLQVGALRTIPLTHLRYRLHDQNCGASYSSPWKGWRKIVYRVHPLRYYRYYLRYTDEPVIRMVIGLLIPVKHIYAQISFWLRGVREIVTGQQRI